MPTAIYLGFEVDIGMAVTLSAILLVISFLAILVVKTLTAPREED
jgi:ABC-type sulfate transport system permease component